jgi:hypothetical protein
MILTNWFAAVTWASGLATLGGRDEESTLLSKGILHSPITDRPRSFGSTYHALRGTM